MAEVNSYARYFGATYPAESDVREWEAYGDTNNTFVGTLDVSDETPIFPSMNDVRLGVTYGNQTEPDKFTGNVRVPPPEKVERDYAYDSMDSVIGDLTVLIMPEVEDVRLLVEYGDVPADPSLGVLQLPMPSQVLAGVGYGAYGTEFEGTLTDAPGGGGSTLPPVLQSGNLRSPLIIGDRYEIANGRAFIWDVELWEGYTIDPEQLPNFRGWVPGCSCSDYTWLAVGAVTDNGDGTFKLTFELSAKETELIAEGPYHWSVELEDTTLVHSADYGTAQWICG